MYGVFEYFGLMEMLQSAVRVTACTTVYNSNGPDGLDVVSRRATSEKSAMMRLWWDEDENN